MNRNSVVNAALNILNLEVRRDGNEMVLYDKKRNEYLGVIDKPLWDKRTDDGNFSIKMINDENFHLKYCVSLVNSQRAVNMAIASDKSKEFEMAIYDKSDELFGSLYVSDKKLDGQVTIHDINAYNFKALVDKEVTDDKVMVRVDGVSFNKEFSLEKNRFFNDDLTRDILEYVNLIDLFAENENLFKGFDKILDEFELKLPGIKNFIINNYDLSKMMYNGTSSKVLELK